jgi:hypothetical protein
MFGVSAWFFLVFCASADVFTASVERDLHLLLLDPQTLFAVSVILVVLCLVSFVALCRQSQQLLLVDVVCLALRFCVARHIMIPAAPAMIFCVAPMVHADSSLLFTSCAGDAVSHVIDMLYDSGTALSFDRLLQSPCVL